MIIKGLNIRKRKLISYLLTIIISFFVGAMMLFLLSINANPGTIEKPDFTVGMLGTIVSMVVFLAVYLLFGIINYSKEFSEMVSFGLTRKNFFIQEMVVSYIQVAISAVCIIALYYFENKVLLAHCYKKFVVEEFIKQKTFFILIVVAILTLPVVRAALGGFMIKVGQTVGFWVLWILWMIGCITPDRVRGILKDGPKSNIQKVVYDIATQLLQIPNTVWIVCGVVLAVVLTVAAWLFIRNKEVEI